MALAKIIQFRRGRRTINTRHVLIQIENISSRDNASKYVGKKVEWTTDSGKKILGKIVSPHGNKGVVRAIFEKGLPGQAITKDVKLIE